MQDDRPDVCRRKIGYTSQKQARIALRKMQAKKGAREQQVYRCPFCTWYHIGTKRRRIGGQRDASQWINGRRVG